MNQEFKDYLHKQLLADRIPFSLDIKPEPHEGPFDKVGRFQLPVYGEGLGRELLFFDFLASTLGNRQIEFQVEMVSLTRLLKEELGIETDAIARNNFRKLFFGVKDGEEALGEEYEDFYMRHVHRFMRLLELARVMADASVSNWLKITFFLISRHDENWGPSQTAALRDSEIKAILDFINRELNGGVPPESPPEDLGNSLNGSEPASTPAVKTGEKSTGNSTLATSGTTDSATSDLVLSPTG